MRDRFPDPEFRAAFLESTHRSNWKTPEGRSHWVEGAHWVEAIAGPLASVFERGECDFVYGREDAYFRGVSDPASLYVRLLEWHAKLSQHLGSFSPVPEDEQQDKQFMMQLLVCIRSIIDRAVAIESRRWQMRAVR